MNLARRLRRPQQVKPRAARPEMEITPATHATRRPACRHCARRHEERADSLRNRPVERGGAAGRIRTHDPLVRSLRIRKKGFVNQRLSGALHPQVVLKCTTVHPRVAQKSRNFGVCFLPNRYQGLTDIPSGSSRASKPVACSSLRKCDMANGKTWAARRY